MRSVKEKTPRMMSIGLFAAAWFIVCAATAMAAIEFPINRLLNRDDGVNRIPQENVYSDSELSPSTEERVGAAHGRYGRFRFQELLDDMPRLADGTAAKQASRANADKAKLEPIDAVCRFVSSRNVEELFKAVHPKLAEYIKTNFGAALRLLDGSDTMLVTIVRRMFGDAAADMAGARKIGYEVKSCENCGAAEMRRIEENAEVWEPNLKVSDAVRLELKLTIETESGEMQVSCSPIVYRTSEGWFINADSSAFGG